MSLFTDYDEGEKLLNDTSVSDLNAMELLSYVQAMYKAKFGYPLIITAGKDRRVVEELLVRYKKDAGQVLKWFFWAHQGQYLQGKKLQNFKLNWFGPRWSEWTDELYFEMQEHLKKEQSQQSDEHSKEATSLGFLTLQDFSNDGRSESEV